MKMPSIKKKVTGFIRQLSSSDGKPRSRRQYHGHKTVKSPIPQSEKCFIQRYLSGEEARPAAPDIQFGKTGHQLPPVTVAPLDPEVFAAYTGPAGGITCIQRRKETQTEGESGEASEDLDYIDIEYGGRVVSRRASINEVLQKMETLSSSDKLPFTDQNESNKPLDKPRIPKSPTTTFSFIDNSVMNIRVGDRVYRVDDNKRQNLIETSPEFETPCPPSLSTLASPSARNSLSRTSMNSPSTRNAVSPSASNQNFTSITSDIIDIDEELDLVETEDGYVPASSLRSQDETDSYSGKRVTIKSPTRLCTNQRPSSLSLKPRSRNSFSSVSSVGTESPHHSGPQSLPTEVSSSNQRKSSVTSQSTNHTKASNHQSDKSTNINQASQKTANQNPPSKSDYPELQPGPAKGLVSPTISHMNDTTHIETKLKLDLKDDISSSIAGIRYWNRPNSSAFGLSDSLYEKHPFTGIAAGSPIADTFAVVARKNSAILVLGDGVNWGPRAALASRAAVHGAMEYLNQALFGVTRTRTLTTQDVFQILLRSFHAAHCLILEEEAMLTTLTAAVVLPTLNDKGA